MQTPSDNASSILVYKALKEVIFQARNLIVKLLHKPDATEALLALEKATLQYSNVFSTAASTPGYLAFPLCCCDSKRCWENYVVCSRRAEDAVSGHTILL